MSSSIFPMHNERMKLVSLPFATCSPASLGTGPPRAVSRFEAVIRPIPKLYYDDAIGPKECRIAFCETEMRFVGASGSAGGWSQGDWLAGLHSVQARFYGPDALLAVTSDRRSSYLPWPALPAKTSRASRGKQLRHVRYQ